MVRRGRPRVWHVSDMAEVTRSVTFPSTKRGMSMLTSRVAVSCISAMYVCTRSRHSSGLVGNIYATNYDKNATGDGLIILTRVGHCSKRVCSHGDFGARSSGCDCPDFDMEGPWVRPRFPPLTSMNVRGLRVDRRDLGSLRDRPARFRHHSVRRETKSRRTDADDAIDHRRLSQALDQTSPTLIDIRIRDTSRMCLPKHASTPDVNIAASPQVNSTDGCNEIVLSFACLLSFRLYLSPLPTRKTWWMASSLC
ncbi:hypothetical protein C8T65DRAFT_177545 [Cerioporus squamosus]|nr:hypothetical protein C8T65DRAFT_177545 [Cerioporus squamosus]